MDVLSFFIVPKPLDVGIYHVVVLSPSLFGALKNNNPW